MGSLLLSYLHVWVGLELLTLREVTEDGGEDFQYIGIFLNRLKSRKAWHSPHPPPRQPYPFSVAHL